MTQSVRAIWQEMHKKGQCLDPLTSIGWDVCQDFQECIESEYPWICLCEDHWKADQIWINNFSNWRLKTSLQGVVVQPTNLKRECSIEEAQAGPSKKSKPTDKKPLPQPKPTKAGVKVSLLFFGIYATAEYIQATPL